MARCPSAWTLGPPTAGPGGINKCRDGDRATGNGASVARTESVGHLHVRITAPIVEPGLGEDWVEFGSAGTAECVARGDLCRRLWPVRRGGCGSNLRGGRDPSPLLGLLRLFALVGYPGRGLTVVVDGALLPRGQSHAIPRWLPPSDETEDDP